jgi:hypothetical protein
MKSQSAWSLSVVSVAYALCISELCVCCVSKMGIVCVLGRHLSIAVSADCVLIVHLSPDVKIQERAGFVKQKVLLQA